MASNIEKANTGVEVVKKQKSIFKRKKLWIIAGIGVIALLVAVKFALSKPAGKIVNIADASRKDIVQSISVTGNIKANQEDKSLLNVSQKVVDVMVKEGQDVKKGTPLVKLDTADLDYQLKRAMLSLSSAKDNYENGKKTVEDAVTQAQAAVQKAQGDYDQAKRKFDGNQVLLDAGYISKEEYESSKTQLVNCENQLKIAQAQLETANKNLADYSKSSQLKQQVDLYNTDVENLNKKLADSVILSNIDGKVVRLDATVGEYPKSDKNTVLVCDLSVYKVDVALSQYDSVRVKVGQKATLKVKGVDKEYTGTVSKIGEVANITVEGTSKESKVDIEITIDNPDELIKVGYETDAEIVLNERKGVLSVNYEAVKQDNNGKYIFVVENGKAVKKYVKTGVETEFDVEITEGLNDGDKYISAPNDTIKEGDTVTAPVENKK